MTGGMVLHAQRETAMIQEMAHRGVELRNDWAMRQYVGSIIAYLLRGGDRANAKMNMNERGVPGEVQRRVLDGRAALY